MSKNFDRIADRYDETRGGVERGAQCASVIAPHLAGAGVILEIGVGTGLVAEAMGRPVVGVDISAEMLGRARDRVGARLAQGDGAALPFANQIFAGGYSVWVFHLVADMEAVLHEVARVLAPGGRYLILTTERLVDGEIESVMSDLYSTLLPGVRKDDENMIAAAAAAAGLAVVDMLQPLMPFTQSPAQAVANIETRAGAAFWDLDDATWQAVVEPALARLRALPDQERQRDKTGRYPTLVLEKKN